MTEADRAAEIASFRVALHALAARVHRCEEWIDVVSSPWWKRVWFVLGGWRWCHLGRWRGRDLSRWP